MTPHYTTLFRSIDDGEISVRPLLHIVHRNPMRQCQKEHVGIIIINLTRRDQGDIYCIVQMGMDSSQALAFIRFTGDKLYRYIWVLCKQPNQLRSCVSGGTYNSLLYFCSDISLSHLFLY